MDKQQLIRFCLTMPDTYSDQPFHDPGWTVIRCRGNRKVFAWIFERQEKVWINLKTDPEWRDFWRKAYPSILPAYHLNKEHWNSLVMDGSIPEQTVRQLIMESYDLVCPKEKKRKQADE